MKLPLKITPSELFFNELVGYNRYMIMVSRDSYNMGCLWIDSNCWAKNIGTTCVLIKPGFVDLQLDFSINGRMNFQKIILPIHKKRFNIIAPR